MRWLQMFFARRYLFSRKSHSVINVISGVSAFAVGIPVAAMVILFSVFNGFEGLVRGMYRAFDPDIEVTAAAGKTFRTDSVDLYSALRSLPGVEEVSLTLEDNALLEYDGRQFIGTVLGVDSLYDRTIPVEGMIVRGKWELMFGDMEQAVVGQGLAYSLGISPEVIEPLYIYAARRGMVSSILPMESYRSERLFPAGIFALEAETDGKYVITPIDFARRLFGAPDRASAVLVKLAPKASPEATRTQIQAALGDDFRVRTRAELRMSLYRIMKYEKWGIFFIGILVLVVASFSIVGSLVMLIVDKGDDISTLSTLGGDARFLRGIFLREGMLISSLGAGIGLLLGLAFSFGQQYFGWIAMPAATFLVDSYPVEVKWGDVALIVVTFTAINYAITLFTVTRMIPRRKAKI